MATGDDATWASMLPGTVPNGTTVTVRNGGVSAPVTAPMMNGGFDPVSIAARAGDLLTIVTERQGGHPVTGYARVPATRKPHVVRANPGRQKTDVPLNIRIDVVFSQPVDPATLAEGVRLLRDGSAVAGTVSATSNEGDVLGAAFTPAMLLDPSTTYQVVVSASVRDRNGEPLEAEFRQDFTTGVATSDAVAPVVTIVTPGTGETRGADWLMIGARATDDVALESMTWWVLDAPGFDGPHEKATMCCGGSGMPELSGTYRAAVLATTGTLTWQVTAADQNGNVGRSEPITITLAPFETTQVLETTAFSVIEYQYPGSTQWYYAPQLSVNVLGGSSGVTMQGFEMRAISGLQSPFPEVCHIQGIEPGASREMFHVFYGDYDLSFYDPRNVRATGEPATARFYYRDAAGKNYALDLTGPIVPGSLPSGPNTGTGAGWGCY